VSIVALLLTVFEISYSFGQFYVDRTRPVPFLDWFYGTLAIWWVIATYRKNASPRVRKWALAVVLPLVSLTALTSFGAGKSTRYPEEARKLVETLQLHAREVKRIKSEISEARSTFSEPEDLLTIQPKVSALKEHTEEVDKLTHQIAIYEVPADISQIMTLLGQALPTEKRQIANLENQIALVRSAQGLRSNEKLLIYRQQLLPLIQQEEQIERERQDTNLEEKIKNIPQKSGYK
jgi:hypothetical protein